MGTGFLLVTHELMGVQTILSDTGFMGVQEDTVSSGDRYMCL